MTDGEKPQNERKQGKRRTSGPSSLFIHTRLKQTKPSSRHEQPNEKREKRHFLDHLTAYGALAAAFGAFLAAGFSWWQADISNQAYITSERAFVYFDPPTFIGMNQTASTFGIEIPMGNSGNTPTRDVYYRMGCFFPNTQNKIVKIPKPFPIAATDTVIGPKVILTPIACMLTLGNNGQITNSDGVSANTVLVMGQALYSDILQPNKRRETRFCYTISEFKSAGGLTDLNALTEPCGHSNCTDEQCKEEGSPFSS